MRTVFFFVLLFFLGSLSYVVWHLWRIVPGGWVPKLLAALLFVVWMVTAFAVFWLPDKAPVPVTSALYEVGYPWMIAFLYLLLAFLLADAMYEKSWGCHRRGTTDYYVSSGLGIWGPKIRLGTRSEYLVLRISESL